MSKENFIAQITEGYNSENALDLGAAMYQGEVQKDVIVKLPLKMFNRHGLIAGATGTGKTKTMQVIAEQLSNNGIPSMLIDIKGDLSGIAKPGEKQDFIGERHDKIGFDWQSAGAPVELMTISNQKGVRLRATVHEFGPILFSKILGLNDTQTGIFSVIFKYCGENNLTLVDLNDVKEALKFAMSDEGNAALEKEYGKISSSSVGVMLRQIAALEEQGADRFFGEPSFEVPDLMKTDRYGKGMINILRVMDIQNKPKFFATFMMQLLAEIYETLPEEGDLEKPKFVMFIDEAHLIFDSDTPKVLVEQLEVMVRLIRSKGVGIFFVTQNPADIDDNVLGQLGLKVQHALRAFTAKDRKAIKAAAQNYPETEHYDVEELITSLGIGEALVTTLNEKGTPTPLVRTYLRAPQSRMDVLTDAEVDELLGFSNLFAKYDKDVDPESAAEILNAKMAAYEAKAEEAEEKKEQEKLAAEQAKIEKAREKEEAKAAKAQEKSMDKVKKEVGKGLLNAAIGFGLRAAGVKTRRRKFF